LLSNLNYIISLLILVIGLYSVCISKNLIKKLLAMVIFQSAILLFFVSMAKVKNSKVPILVCANFSECPEVYTNPIPHVLMLTAIVVGVATLAVGLAIISKIKENFGTIAEDEIEQIIRK